MRWAKIPLEMLLEIRRSRESLWSDVRPRLVLHRRH